MARLTATAVHESNLTHRVISPARLRLKSVIIAIAVVTGVMKRNQTPHEAILVHVRGVFSMLLISYALLILARHRALPLTSVLSNHRSLYLQSFDSLFRNDRNDDELGRDRPTKGRAEG